MRVHQENSPKSCDECREAQRFREDDTECWYKTCPFDEFGESLKAPPLYAFLTMCLEKSEIPEDEGRIKKAVYFVEPARFELACRLYWVPDGMYTYYTPRLPLIRDQLHALEMAKWLASLLERAPNARKAAKVNKANTPGAGGSGWQRVV